MFAVFSAALFALALAAETDCICSCYENSQLRSDFDGDIISGTMPKELGGLLWLEVLYVMQVEFMASYGALYL